MILNNFLEDFKTYTLKKKISERNAIGQVSWVFESTEDIYWIIIKLRNPKEIQWTFNKIISEFACYTKNIYIIKKGDLISDWEDDFEVIDWVKSTWLWWDSNDVIKLYYLQLTK